MNLPSKWFWSKHIKLAEDPSQSLPIFFTKCATTPSLYLYCTIPLTYKTEILHDTTHPLLWDTNWKKKTWCKTAGGFGVVVQPKMVWLLSHCTSASQLLIYTSLKGRPTQASLTCPPHGDNVSEWRLHVSSMFKWCGLTALFTLTVDARKHTWSHPTSSFSEIEIKLTWTEWRENYQRRPLTISIFRVIVMDQ